MKILSCSLVSSVLLLIACGARGPLSVEAVVPAQGSARGGLKVRVTGTGFDQGVVVTLGGTRAKVTVVSAQELTLVTPQGISGPAALEVALGGDRALLRSAFVYEPMALSFVDVSPEALPSFPVDGAGVALADGDGDGDLELFQAARAEGVLLFENRGALSFAAPRLLPLFSADGGVGPSVNDLSAADFDGDGKIDLVLGTAARSTTALLRGDGRLGFSALPFPPLFGVAQTLVAADLDGDGDLDLISLGASATADGSPAVRLLFNERGAFKDLTAERLPGEAFDAPGAVAGDLDRDGKVDLFFSGTTAPNRLYLGDGHGAFARAAPDALPIDSAPASAVPALGDVDGDGSPDLVVPTATRARVLANDGTGHFEDVTSLRLGDATGPSTRAVLKDLDLDGRLDVLLLDKQGRARLYRNDGKGRFFDYSSQLISSAQAPGTDLAVGDLDGDGDDDLLVGRSDFARPTLFLNWGPRAATDSDGDGFPDLADDCPARADPAQGATAVLPFGCRSGAACASSTGCELRAAGESAYLFCRDAPLAWAAAQTRCKALGGNLVSIGSAEENAFLAPRSGAQAWIGFQDQATEGQFVWASGEPTGFTRWGATQPDNSMGNEDCTALLASGLWNDDNCASAKGYVCEAPRREIEPSQPSCTPDAGQAADAGR